jgi:Fe-S-cluster containining protein
MAAVGAEPPPVEEPTAPEPEHAADDPGEDEADDFPGVVEPAEAEDVERGFRFDHLMLMQLKQRVAELATSLTALVETCVAEGLLPVGDYERRRQRNMQREVERTRREALVVLADEPDKYEMAGLPEIDCAALLPLCRARCCTQPFALSPQDLDERVIKWDYGRPYQISRGDDSYCVHNDPRTRACRVHGARPAFCRRYDCREDPAIWTDFAKRIPAP